MFQDLNENIIKNNFRKDIEDLLLQANMAKLKKVASITEKNLQEEEVAPEFCRQVWKRWKTFLWLVG